MKATGEGGMGENGGEELRMRMRGDRVAQRFCGGVTRLRAWSANVRRCDLPTRPRACKRPRNKAGPLSARSPRATMWVFKRVW